MKALGDISNQLNEGAGFTSAVSVLGRNENNNYYDFDNDSESKRIKTKTTPRMTRSADVTGVSSGLLRFSISFYLNCFFIYFLDSNRTEAGNDRRVFRECFGLFSVRHFRGRPTRKNVLVRQWWILRSSWTLHANGSSSRHPSAKTNSEKRPARVNSLKCRNKILRIFPS